MSLTTSFEMTELDRQKACLSTIINMLISRKWLNGNVDDVETIKPHLDKYTKMKEIIDSVQIECNNKSVAVKFYNMKLNTLKNDREIDTFLSNYPTSHKILVVAEIAPKAEKQIMDSKNFEVFRSMDIIRDISRHHLVPKHELLSKEDATLLMEEYRIKKKDMGRIYIDDPMARYLYAQKDDIIQIIRENINSGYSTYYRLVVVGSIYG